MPHIIVEHSEDISQNTDIATLVKELHEVLSEQETVKLSAIKSRSILVDHVIVGAPHQQNSMVHISVLLMPGRSKELKETMASAMHSRAREVLDSMNTSITVNVEELGTYYS
ncbi:MAG: 5-carboxymethyl-2-hydroxymuconate Delta-isomerase [Bdellovibrionales bacterium]